MTALRSLGFLASVGYLVTVAAGCGGDSTAPAAGAGPGGGGAAGGGGSAAAGAGGGAGAPMLRCDPALVDAFQADLLDNTSCVLVCASPDCAESTKPWVCPALAPFATIPHDCAPSACGHWDGTYPPPQSGKCAASAPTADALAKTNTKATPPVLPDGRHLTPAGTEWVFQDDLVGTFPFSMLRVPGTPFVVVSDDGADDNALRVVDLAKLAAGQSPVSSQLKFASPLSLNGGLALHPDGTLYAASGAPDSVVRAFTIDAGGKLAALAAKNVTVANGMPAAKPGVFPFGIAISPDGKKLVVGQVKESLLLVYSVEAATYGTKLDQIDLGGKGLESFSVVFDPKSSDMVYASVWTDSAIREVNLATKTVKSIPTGKHPEKIVFLDANYLAVADALADDIAIIDRAASMTVTHVPIDVMALHGSGPTALAYDDVGHRLYATLSGRNGVAVFDVTPSSGPGVAPVLKATGVLPTAWWPTDVVVSPKGSADAGAVTILNGKGHGTGPVTTPMTQLCCGVIGEQMKGSIQTLPSPASATLSQLTDAWAKASVPAKLPGAPTVTCPSGAAYDFPVPLTNTDGPSKLIDHVVFIVRENKTYDAVMGDVPGADGDPTLVMAPGRMDQIWPNFRKAAKTFAHGDNFYEDAEQSIQGHFWTAFGRMNDYTERTWLTTWYRGTRGPIPNQGVGDDTSPLEGSIFQWLEQNKVPYDNMGEDLGSAPLDPKYGFVSTSKTVPDTKSACYMATRARVTCDLKPFTYAWYVNDHTFGGAAGKPNPATMIAVNDEATGMFVDALSHSPLWKSSLVVVIEDDPQDGADHVDAHRSIVLLASPWVKRGYVTHTHFDVAAIHKLFAHLYGIPYNNQTVADAAIPFDAFTSTPDYTPFEYVPRQVTDLSCNKAGTSAAQIADKWDFSEPDEQPGLGRQVHRMLHGEE